jgi:RNA polymerase sigma-70 factor (ECF subfamily)
MVVAPTEAEPANWEAVSSEDLDAAVQMLALHYREVIILRDLQGLNYRDISAMLDLPMGTVMSRLHRARTELKKTLVWRLRGQRSRRAR